MSDFERFLYRAASIAMLVAFIIGLFFLYLYFWPVNVLQVQGKPKVSPAMVHPGEVTNIQLHYCKKRSLLGQWHIELVGPPLTPDLGGRTHLPVGCGQHDLPIIIPQSTQPGTYPLHVEVTYLVNPVRSETYTFDTEPVEVVR